MARKTSPFAALTSEEKHLKWLEVQSVRLPYVQGNVDELPAEKTDTQRDTPKQTPDTLETPPQVINTPAPSLNPSEYQKTRHRQYDAVIARMRQAEKRASQFSEWSK